MDSPKIATNKDTNNQEFELSLSSNEVKDAKSQIIKEFSKQFKAPGFRQGKAPLSLVKSSLDKDKLRDEVVRKLIPNKYQNAIEKLKIAPISTPKISTKSIKDGEPWTFLVEIAQKPKVVIAGYKAAIKKIKLPKKDTKDDKDKHLEKVFETLIKSTKVTLPQLLVEQETHHALKHLQDQIEKLNISLDDYAKSIGKNAQDIVKDYTAKAIERLHLDFVIEKIVEDEKLQATKEQVESFIKDVKDKATREAIEISPEQQKSITQSLTNQNIINHLSSLLPKTSNKKTKK